MAGVLGADGRLAGDGAELVASTVGRSLGAHAVDVAAAGHLVGADDGVEHAEGKGAVGAVGSGRTAHATGRRLHAMGAELASDALDRGGVDAGDLGVFLQGVLVDVVLEEEVGAANLDARNLALIFKLTGNRVGVEGGFAALLVDDDVVGLGCGVLVLGLGNLQARLLAAHELTVIGVAFVRDDQVRSVGVSSIASVERCLVVGEFENGWVSEALVEHDVDHAQRKCGVGRRLDGHPIDALGGGGNATVAQDGVKNVHGALAGLQASEDALGDALEALAGGTGEGAHPENVFAVLEVALGVARSGFRQHTADLGAASSGAMSILVY